MRPLLLLIFLLLGVPGLSSAQAPGYDGLIRSALEAYDTGRFVEARSLFKRAHALSPSARTMRGVGMCSFNLGDYVDAMLHLEAALDDASRPLTSEQRAAADELVDRASRKIGRFRLQVSPEGTAVTVDGAAAVRSVRGDILVEPGRHELAVSAAGYRTAQRTLSVDPGDRAALELRLEPSSSLDETASAPAAGPPAAVVVVAASTSPDAPAPAHLPARRFGIAAVTLGAASLAMFAVTGSMALETKGDLDKACAGQLCPPPKHDDLDAYGRQRLMAGVSLYAGAALLGAGVTALVWRAHARAGHAALTPVVGLGYVGLRGAL